MEIVHWLLAGIFRITSAKCRKCQCNKELPFPVRNVMKLLNKCSLFFSVRESNMISVWNNGKGIPVVEHKDEKMYVPALIFGHLLTSSNYDDDEKKVTGN